MARAKKKQEKEKPKIHVQSMTLTPETEKTLQRLSGEASDYIGRKVSGSAMVRALLRFADKQESQWVLAQLCPMVEKELSLGVIWGKKK
jgi:hypothetical protein